MTGKSAKKTPEEMELIGSRIARLRSMRGWSQRELAIRAGLPQPALCRFEREGGGRDGWNMTLESAWRLAYALGCSIDVLAGMPDLRGDP